MRLRVFHSAEGDCVLLTSGNGRHALIDGGRHHAFRRTALPTLQKIAADDDRLDLVCVSHIDQDHIEGILGLLDLAVEWKVFDFQQDSGNVDYPQPTAARPPEIRRIWHNAFHEQVGANAGPIADLLAASAALLAGPGDLAAGSLLDRRVGAEVNIANGYKQGIQLSRRIGHDQLGIPLNAEFDKKLATITSHRAPTMVGSTAITVIGPSETDMRELRTAWNTWLDKNTHVLEEIATESAVDVERLGTGELDGVLLALRLRANRFADRSEVTPQNLASIMFLAEEGGKCVLFTGDGHGDDVVSGLDRVGRHRSGDGFHVNVLKVQHHGSEHNLDYDFARTVTADHYLFCGDGAHHNPDKSVVKAVIDARVGGSGAKAVTTQQAQPFKLWFNADPDLETMSESRRAHMKEIKGYVKDRAKGRETILRFAFLESGNFHRLDL